MNELEQTRLALSNLPGNRMKHPFTDEELLMIFEAIRVVFNDVDVFERTAEALDVRDSALYALDNKVCKFMNSKKENNATNKTR